MSALVILLLLGFLVQATRSFVAGDVAGSTGVSLSIGFVLLSAFFAGRISRRISLPKLTGYLAIGVVVGPSALGLVTHAMLDQLQLVNGVAIALIAMTAGTELEFRKMRADLPAISWISVTAVLGTAVLLSVVILLMANQLPFMHDATFFQRASIAFVLGSVLVAQSPAVVIALHDELDADGPVARTVLGVVVLADFVVIIAFAIASAVTKSALGGQADLGGTFASLAWELPGSVAVGMVIGAIVVFYLARVAQGHSLFVAAVAFVIAEAGTRVHFDPLLVALGTGLFVRNASRYGDVLHARIEVASLPVYLLFFAVAGASLHLDALRVVGLPIVVLVATRALGLVYGSRAGAKLAKAPEAVFRYAGFGLVPQAGLALALSLLFARTFPEFGAPASALTLGAVALNELFAPAFYRWSLARSGDSGQRRRTSDGAP